MDATHTQPTPTPAATVPVALPLTPAEPEPAGTIWIDFGDGGSARWAGLSMDTIDEVCARLEAIKKPDTLS